MTTPLQRHGDEFVERNTLLHLGLGLSARLDRWTRAALRPPTVPCEPVEDDGLVDVVMGLVALRRHLARVLDEAARSSPPPTAVVSPTRGERAPLR